MSTDTNADVTGALAQVGDEMRQMASSLKRAFSALSDAQYAVGMAEQDNVLAALARHVRVGRQTAGHGQSAVELSVTLDYLPPDDAALIGKWLATIGRAP